MTDFIPDLEGAPAQKRGGWTGIGGTLAGAASATGIAWAPFSAGAQLVMIGNNGDLCNAFDGTDLGTAGVPSCRPVFFQNKLYIANNGTVKHYDGSGAPANLGSISASHLTSYKSRMVYGESTKISFSGVLDPSSVDSLSFINPTNPLTGLAALRNMIAVFSLAGCERIRGSIPPSSTSEGDMTLEPMFNEGCIDARSIVVTGDKVIWANSNGVHISDGAAIDNLIALGGLQQYWTDTMAAYTSSWSLAGGLYGGYYVISIMNGGTFVDALMCNLARKTWVFLSNLRTKMFAEAYGSAPELYFGQAGVAKAAALSPIFRPSGTNTTDGDGTAVQPMIELPAYRGQPGSKRWRNVYVGVDLVAAGGTYLKVSVATTPDDTTYDAVVDDAGAEIHILPTSGFQRVKIPVHLAADSLALKIEQVGASTSTTIFDIESDTHDREGLK